MRIVIAMDSFKGSLSSPQAGHAVRRGILRACPQAECVLLGLADGGEGTSEILCAALGGEMVRTRVTGPLGEPVEAAWGYVEARGLAIVEMAAAAGLPMVPPERRDPMRTTTFGVGELICEAIARGAKELVICLGGSATNDGALGALTALGGRFFDAEGQPVGFFGADMCRVARADFAGLNPALRGVKIRLACDVENPLCGPTGAAAVFAPQKGASPAAVAALDAGLSRYADALSAVCGCDLRHVPGAGAAGGMAYGLMQTLGAGVQMGAELVLSCQGAEKHLAGASLAVTGEGRMDGQTAGGKGPAGFCRKAKSAGASTLLLCGSVGSGADNSYADAYFPILPGAMSLEEAVKAENAAENLARTAEQAMRLWLAARKR